MSGCVPGAGIGDGETNDETRPLSPASPAKTDPTYGAFRTTGRYHGKVCPWPIADAICAELAAEGRPVLLLGQDVDLICHLAKRHGAIPAGSLCADEGFDPLQNALFDVSLMARCGTIVCGSSGFAIVASWISGRRNMQCYRYFDTARTVEILRNAALGDPPGRGVSALQHAFACWAAFHAAGRTHAMDDVDQQILDRALGLDCDNDFLNVARAAGRIAAGHVAEGAKMLDVRLRDWETARRDLLYVLKSVGPDGKASLAPFLGDLEAAAGDGHPAAAFMAAVVHNALNAQDEAQYHAALFARTRSAALAFLPDPLDL